MFKGAKKDDLKLIASELNLTVEENMTVVNINDLIENSEIFKTKPDFVSDLARTIIDSRKQEEQRQVEIEKIKLERSKNELELAKLKADFKSSVSESENKESLEQLIKSVRTLTVKIPSRPEGWVFFFSSLERAFNTKNVLEQYKAEILLNLLGDKASNIITYLNDEDIANYEKIKEIVLREFQPTPYSCLENFRKTSKQSHETYVQFASRLVTNWDYYLHLRKVSDFETFKQLIVSDKLYQTLDKETASHISVRQGDKWFSPSELGKEVDLYLTSRGKPITENFGANRKNTNSKSVSKVFLSDVKTLNCKMCNENHGLGSCPSYLKLSVQERIEVLKRYRLCFNCLRLHSVSACTSKYTCFCGKRHHSSIHFPKEINSANVKESVERNNQGKFSAAESSDSGSKDGSSTLNANAEEFVHKTFMSNYSSKKSTVLLSTVICFLIDKTGQKYPVKCLLDVGSQSNFVSRRFIELLQLNKEKTNILVSGLNDATLVINQKVNAPISNKDGSFVKNLDFLVVPKITEDLTPSQKIEISKQDFPNVKLADDRFNIPERVDMLLGAGIFYELLKPGQIRVSNSDLILQDTVFGFIVSGSFSTKNENRVHCGLIKEEINLNKTLKKFWEIENIEVEKPKDKELAMRTLLQLSKDEENKFPLAAPVLREYLYMDDVFSSAESLSSALELQNQLVNLLKSGGMTLHKWFSNAPELCQADEKLYSFNEKEESKALGVLWKSKKDCLSFNVKIENEVNITKRQVLSTISSIFDPLGLVAPVIIKAKIFMQKLWLLTLNWDDFLSETEANEWKEFVTTLPLINNIEISRCILLEDPITIELHGFSDASEVAYGAAIYCKTVTKSGEVSVNLVTSKSRVSPLKQLTIPRLELCAAVLLAKLTKRVVSALKIKVNSFFLWSDSMIVLSWIKKEPFQLKTFVANRISTIQELTEGMQWRHVSTQENPADLLSRGVSPDKLKTCELWWHGPVFLKGNDFDYPKRDIPSAVMSDFSNELKNCDFKNDFKNCISFFAISNNSFVHNIIDLSNNYSKIIRIIGFIFRFISNCKKEKKEGPLSVGELDTAEKFLLRSVQREVFNKDIKSLQKTGKINNNSKLKNLHPFLDEEGILRVGGRLVNSKLNANQKFPILVDCKSKLTNLIIENVHKRYLHLGPQALLFQLRQKFWPLNGRAICRKIVHRCIVCFKAKPIPCQQFMGDLPKERVTQNYPFNCSGVDFMGPFLIRYKNQRKGIYHKVYVAIFICFATRAIHLEIVTELTSHAFIETLKRFFARRGKIACLFSDNATNFIGSNKELKRLHNLVRIPDNELSGYLSNESVDWKFIPPRAPNFGGLWEAGVKSVKYHLKRVMGNAKLTYEGFLTVITQIEGILNSRPLVPFSSDADDLNALTPAHFLIGRPINSIVEPDITSVHENKLKLWERTTKIVQLLWKKWSKDYLSSLQQRNKWMFEKDNVKVDDLVIIKEDNTAIYSWPLGRIVELFPGADGKIRVVNVKTQQGTFKRPISKICLLPI